MKTNRSFKMTKSFTLIALLAMVALSALLGCDAPDARFRLNRVYVQKQLNSTGSEEAPHEQLQDVAASLEALFGTPDNAYPSQNPLGMEEVINVKLLEMAAGAVGRDENQRIRGLYREHCVHCHGVTGDGHGPTAEFLNPYPRDFRRGLFKFKSTPKGEKPTDADLHKTLVNGVPGTAMPSFKLLPSDQIDSLVAYVKYLSIRGEVERELINTVTLELEPEDELETSRDFLVDTVLSKVVGKWARANDSVTEISPREDFEGDERQAAIDRGRLLFHGTVANCIKCHGVTALGDGQTTDYDDWTKDFEDWTKPLSDEDRAAKVEQYLSLGGLPIRNIIPRNLRRGVYRGGRRPVDIFWRIKNGIEGTPMPEAASALSDDDIWDIVTYVQHLPYDTLSQPPDDVLENLRQNP